MTINFLGGDTNNHGHREIPSIVVEILCVGGVVISGLMSMLKRWCNAILDKNLVKDHS